MNINFSKNGGLIPCVVQDARTQVVLMLAYMNEEAYLTSIREQRLTFYSRSRQRLWTKGETSGNFLKLVEFKLDCDQDTLLAKAIPAGPVCHTGSDTCFNERNIAPGLQFLEDVITERRLNPKEGSYTNKLLNAGINKIAQKVGEEAVELVIESKDQNDELFLNEAADLMYHYLVLLQAKGKNLNDVVTVLQKRHG
ncbi:MAG: bifunctional phosphoribosyl-AMP cyclohydrolase/phosphoribosyl-ATP diphosphatase HisIE [Cyclobacteriaceae bacterium]|nr:bifunctional phosphoribosyl-AMP cyclohydrolase/phosphoribosyl-ATP diphosphatase HisIE [Cyclobacteriaceae bacterium]